MYTNIIIIFSSIDVINIDKQFIKSKEKYYWF